MSIPQIAALDFETDPFKFDRIPHPFRVGVAFNNRPYWDFLGDDCADKFCDYIATIKEPHIFYAHNGGRFDILFFIHRLNVGEIKIINGRIISAKIGIHEVRDSMAVFQMSLKSANNKDTIDYSFMEKENREKNKEKIAEYLRADCEYLLELMNVFVAQTTSSRSKKIGLTAAGAAYKQLIKTCPQPFNAAPKDNPKALEKWLTRERGHDALFRSFYRGGRVEPFKTGIITGDFRLYDVNSMYPAVMRNYTHPRGRGYTKIDNPIMRADGRVRGFSSSDLFFIDFDGECEEIAFYNPSAKRTEYGPSRGNYRLVSHEFLAAFDLGKIKIDRVNTVWIPDQVQNFAAHVDKFYALRQTVKGVNKPLDTMYKLFLNSPYGKFAFDYSNYKEQILDNGNGGLDYKELELEGWSIGEQFEDEYGLTFAQLLERPNQNEGYFDVAIGASITAAARAELMRARVGAKNALYCDTDSLLCEEIGPRAKVGGGLGEWKQEIDGIDTAAISGKKLYALFKGGVMVKDASKGVKLTPMQHLQMAGNPGQYVQHFNHAPTMGIGKAVVFQTRRVRQV